jgi:hypothetical protein
MLNVAMIKPKVRSRAVGRYLARDLILIVLVLWMEGGSKYHLPFHVRTPPTLESAAGSVAIAGVLALKKGPRFSLARAAAANSVSRSSSAPPSELIVPPLNSPTTFTGEVTSLA